MSDPDRCGRGGVPVVAAGPAQDFGPVTEIVRQLDGVQVEMNALRAELNLLRRRDETINFYMHRLDEEMRLAARFQQDFLPKSLPQVGPLHFHTLFRPAGYVSGDLYDVVRLDERHIGFYLADAVGHGMPAALLTMFIKHALVTTEITPAGIQLLEPGEVLRRLNEALVAQGLSQATFATALYGVIDVQTLQVRIAKAGHPCPLILRHGGGWESVEADGCLLGIFAKETFETRTFQLGRGDRLVVYSDGVEVAFAEDGHADPVRWREELVRRRHLSAEGLLRDLDAHLDQESGSLDPRDDVTLMLIEVEA